MAANASLLSAALLTTQVENVLKYFPDNPLRVHAEPYWISMTNNYTEVQMLIWISLLLHEICYFLICLPCFLCQFIPYMRRFKIQKSKPETFDGQWQCFKALMLSHFFVQFPMILSGYFGTQYFNIPYDWEHMPRWYVIAGQIFLCFCIEDAWHFWIHWLAHDKRLYKHVHKVHHSFTAPFGMIAEYAHPVETVVLGLGFFWGILLLCNHIVMMWAWMFFRLCETIDVHSGYDFPFNPFHLFPFYCGARFHDFHHYNFVGNYASTFTWWDWLFGTDAPYKEYCAKLKQEEHKDVKKTQ